MSGISGVPGRRSSVATVACRYLNWISGCFGYAFWDFWESQCCWCSESLLIAQLRYHYWNAYAKGNNPQKKQSRRNGALWVRWTCLLDILIKIYSKVGHRKSDDASSICYLVKTCTMKDLTTSFLHLDTQWVSKELTKTNELTDCFCLFIASSL